MIQAKVIKKTFFVFLILGWMSSFVLDEPWGALNSDWHYLISLSYIETFAINISGLGLIILATRLLMAKNYTKRTQRYFIILYSIRIIGVMLGGLAWSSDTGLTNQMIIVFGLRFILMLAILGAILWSQAVTRVVINRQLVIKVVGYILFLIIFIIAINTGVSLATGEGINNDLTIDIFSNEPIFWSPSDSLIEKFIAGWSADVPF
ncbi:hypothetical protein ACVQ8P_08430 [Dellaglioa sp. BT-FLS60]